MPSTNTVRSRLDKYKHKLPAQKQPSGCFCAGSLTIGDAKGTLLGFLLTEHDLVHDEENHHGYAAVEDVSADVIQPGGHEVTGHGGPDAVDGIDNAGDHTEGQQIRSIFSQHRTPCFCWILSTNACSQNGKTTTWRNFIVREALINSARADGRRF